MANVLFVTWDGGGNAPPLLSLAAQLRRRGHTVRVMGHPQQSAAAAAAGLSFIPFAHARPFTASVRNSPVRLVALFGDKVMGRDVLAELDARPADLVVVDCLLFGAMDALQRSGTPYVVLEHLFDGYLRGPWLHGPMGLGLRARRLAPWALLDAAEQCLVATVPELDPLSGTSGNRLQTGPFARAERTADRDTPAQAAAQPTVLISLSTYHYGGMLGVWQRALDAVGDLPVRAIATTGPAVPPGRLRAPDNVELRDWAPHDAVMPTVTAVLGHGGHATTMLALAHGLPLLVIPMFKLVDQPLVGRAIERAGAGLALPKRSSAEQIRTALGRLLADAGYRDAAGVLGERIRALDGLTRAAGAVEMLLSVGAAEREASSGPGTTEPAGR